MTRVRFAALVARALYELARYDVMCGLLRVRDVERHLAPLPNHGREASSQLIATINRALVLAACMYWKPARCLQRSICLARLLRAHAIPARLVIGYRPVPFLSHAWVEVDERVVNDSPVYRARLQVLLTA